MLHRVQRARVGGAAGARRLGRLGAVGVLWLWALLACASAAASTPARTDSDDLARLARSGQFDHVLTVLESGAFSDDRQVEDLVGHLQRHERFAGEQRANRQAAYEKAMTDLAALGADGQLYDALDMAVQASTLTDDPAAMLAEPALVALVKKADATAAFAGRHGDWVWATGIYRSLFYLYDDAVAYRPEMDHAQRRVRLLRMYCPQRFAELYRQHAQRMGEDPQELPDFDDESWEETLADVDMSIFHQAILHASSRHVESRGYVPLLQGGMDALLALADTPDLATTFTTLGDDTKVSRFEQDLKKLQQRLGQVSTPMSWADALKTVDEIEQINSDSVRLPRRVLAYELADGAMATLDEFSMVIWPREMRQFNQSTQGKFYGVGIKIERQHGQIVVVTPLPNTPAHRAGILAGDVIAEVNGKSAAAWTLDRAVREITGPKGTEVTLGLDRAGIKGHVYVQIRRDEIPIESVHGWQRTDEDKWDYYIDRNLRIGYVLISNFLPQTADDLDSAIQQMVNDRGLDALILDLRFDPGGLLGAAVEVADRFLTQDTIVSTVGPNGEVTQRYRARRHRTYPPMPLVVLINQGSASASEIVSGALQDYERALVVGQRSFGKGSVQDLFSLVGNKAYLKLTTQYYRLPGGRIIHRKPQATTWGVTPDLIVPMTDEQVADLLAFRQKLDVLHDAGAAESGEAPVRADQIIKEGLDPRLDTALLVLKTQLVADRLATAQAKAAGLRSEAAVAPR